MTVLCSWSLFEILTFLVAVVVVESFVGLVWEALGLLVWEALWVLVVLTPPPLLYKKEGLDRGLLNWLSTVSVYDFSQSTFISSFNYTPRKLCL